MSNSILLAAATITAVAALSFAAAPDAEARKHHHRHGGISVYVGGGPIVYGGYRHYRHRSYYDYSPSYYYRGFEPRCYRWGWVHRRSGKAKWRCVAW